MPLKSGVQNIRSNIEELMTGKIGTTRRKAIKTYAKKHNIPFKDARFELAKAIAVSKSKEK